MEAVTHAKMLLKSVSKSPGSEPCPFDNFTYPGMQMSITLDKL